MKQYGFVTFRPHPNDIDLLEEFKILLSPILNKCDHYLMGHESANTPEAHFHIILSYENKDSDRFKITQKFKNKTLKKFYEKLKNEKRLTQIDPNFHEKALNIKAIPKNEDDYLSTLGYCAKELVVSSRGYSADFVSTAVEFFFKKSRNDASEKPKKPWKVLNSKTFHVYVSDFCEKHDILPNSPELLVEMTKNGIEVNDLPVGKRNAFIASINIKTNIEKQHLQPYQVSNYEKIIQNQDLNLLMEEVTFHREKHNTLFQMLKKYEKHLDPADRMLAGLTLH